MAFQQNDGALHSVIGPRLSRRGLSSVAPQNHRHHRRMPQYRHRAREAHKHQRIGFMPSSSRINSQRGGSLIIISTGVAYHRRDISASYIAQWKNAGRRGGASIGKC